ncbi:glycosyltransferase family 8 protein [Trichoderma virens Gv29-8]|uniref:Glycosyltransferase family 8 protein n=1 Tax=Hypocrea virens (strain Gv29-8 / FGSC 10586) TaxID=413071 RepID=G9MUP3_HYPVG|nr:glycosyltransferase family 8 protein [Trichoderma virens Gv29-8]EHK21840.1 glycosyltransferase family 8 protein [Trichoderma virens Gv29-8]
MEKKYPRFAYAQYATDIDYLCNSVINFNRLKRFGAKYDLVLIFPKAWDQEALQSANTREAKAIEKLRASDLNIVFRPFDILSTDKGDSTWRDSLTKFHAFALIEYTRILAFDSDSLVLNNMDFLFLAPDSPVAMPRAYWLTDGDHAAKQILGSHLMLIEPNTHRYKRIINEAIRSGDFDMEVLNELFEDSAMILPHRRLALLTGEFRNKHHHKYLAPDEDEEWNAIVEAGRAYLVHFSDWPLPKPWRSHTEAQWQAALPECPDIEKLDRPKCADRLVWTGFYNDYDTDKKAYCYLTNP